jgi:hypothetical protein
LSDIGAYVNTKQRRTLRRIFERPTRPDVLWDELASLLKALGGEHQEGGGSRVKFVFSGGRILSLHRPHPRPELKRYAVEDVREFLELAGITPETPEPSED